MELKKSPAGAGPVAVYHANQIAARWADAEVGRPNNTAQTQDNEKVTVTNASETLNVGERGIYHAKTVLENGTPEEIAAANSQVARG